MIIDTRYYNTNQITIIMPASTLSCVLDAWEEAQGRLTDVQSVNGRTTVTVDGSEIVVDDLPESELKPIVGHEVSIVKTESGHLWFAEADQE